MLNLWFFFSFVDLWTLTNVVSLIPAISSISVSIDTSGQNPFSCSGIKGLFKNIYGIWIQGDGF